MKPVKIVLVSDSHGDAECLDCLRQTYSDYDLFVHCGDSEQPYEDVKDFICVKGNNDFLYGNNVPYSQTIHVQDHTVYICHGHMDFLSYFHYEPMIAKAKRAGADIVFFGHVHTYFDGEQDGVRLLNPGSIRHNRDGSRPSYMLVEIDGDDIRVTKKEYSRFAPDSAKEGGFLAKLISFLQKL